MFDMTWILPLIYICFFLTLKKFNNRANEWQRIGVHKQENKEQLGTNRY